MIAYDAGDYHLGFIWQSDGSTLPKAAAFAVPSTVLAIVMRFALSTQDIDLSKFAPASTLVWTITFFCLGVLTSFRLNKAYARFWEGCELVQAMSAEWFESCSNLMAFSLVPLKQKPNDEELKDKVRSFQFRLVHLMSLLHGMALRQIGGEDGEDIEVLDIFGLDEGSLDYLTHTCSELEINRVEVILHWIQVLITESIYDGVLTLPPPILTRSYQTLSRGMVNLHNVRRIADIPFPFPLSQALVVLLLVHSILTPIIVSLFFVSYFWCALVTFLPLMGGWALVFVCGEMEQPFGNDDNDLPLTMQQFDFHTSLMMLVDDRSMAAPTLAQGAATTVEMLRERFGNESSNTSVLYPDEDEDKETMRQALKNHVGEKRSTLTRASTRDLGDMEWTGDDNAKISERHQSPSASDHGSANTSRNNSKLTHIIAAMRGASGGEIGVKAKQPTLAKLMRQRSNLSSASSEQKPTSACGVAETGIIGPGPSKASMPPTPVVPKKPPKKGTGGMVPVVAAADSLLPETAVHEPSLVPPRTQTCSLPGAPRSKSHEPASGTWSGSNGLMSTQPKALPKSVPMRLTSRTMSWPIPEHHDGKPPPVPEKAPVVADSSPPHDRLVDALPPPPQPSRTGHINAFEVPAIAEVDLEVNHV